MPEAKRLTHKAADFLLSQRSSEWSWNYWRRTPPKGKVPSYPDDLDDTANTLAALSLIKPKVIDGAALGSIAQLLIATEHKTGGPYRTWIHAPTAKSWQDVDVVVNANIGYFLSLQGVSVPGLNAFLARCLTQNKLNSPYYIGNIPCLYFLAGWYSDETGMLDSKLKKLLTRPEELNSLMLGLVITASCKRDLPHGQIAPAVSQLISLQQEDHWPAEALYLDPASKGVQHYAGSEVLTTAYAIEALQTYDTLSLSRTKPVTKVTRRNSTLNAAHNFGRSLPPITRATYRAGLTMIEQADSASQITLVANLAAKAYGKPVAASVCEHLNLASLNGWLAYTIYDDFLDDEGQSLQLGAANIAQRQMLWHFDNALPKNTDYHNLVRDVLTVVDTANTWEIAHARATKSGSKLQYTLPNYGSYRQLAEKSQGHMLAVCGVAIASGLDIQSSELYNVRRFFHHFLIAKQLNDDAHDWREDLQRGHLSSVVCMILRDKAPRTCYLSQLPKLRLYFWETTIHEVSGLVLHHIKQARRHLALSGMQNPEILEALLSPLEKGALDATAQQAQAQDFISSYSKSTVQS